MPSKAPAAHPQPGKDRWPADLAPLLERTEQVLQTEGPQKAFELLARSNETTPWITNARAVCLMRLGEACRAAELLRPLVLASHGFSVADDSPVVFKINYATAQLLAGNPTGYIVTMGQIQDELDPAVQRLRDGVRRWRQTFSFWEKVCWFLGAAPDRPVDLGFPPGEL